MMMISFSMFLCAQDQMIKRNGDIIQCKILQIGTEEITYTQPELDANVEFVIEKSKIEKIIFENGSEVVIDHTDMASESTEENSADLFLVQNLNAIKLNFFSPLFGNTQIGFERAVKPGQSFQLDLGIIGLGKVVEEYDPIGVGFKAGYKFIRSPDHFIKKMRYAHILKGGYVMPEIAFASYNIRPDDEHLTKFAFFLTLGKQTVFSDLFLVDWFVSGGYGFKSQDLNSFPFYFGVVGDEFPIAGAAGLRIGLLF
jgi:hypothetical protein